MRTNPKTLIRCLEGAGIHPSSFAHFLIQFIKRKPKKKQSVTSMLLTDHLKGQAKMILLHLKIRS